METYTEELIETYEYFEDERLLYKDSTYDIVSKVAWQGYETDICRTA